MNQDKTVIDLVFDSLLTHIYQWYEIQDYNLSLIINSFLLSSVDHNCLIN